MNVPQYSWNVGGSIQPASLPVQGIQPPLSPSGSGRAMGSCPPARPVSAWIAGASQMGPSAQASSFGTPTRGTLAANSTCTPEAGQSTRTTQMGTAIPAAVPASTQQFAAITQRYSRSGLNGNSLSMNTRSSDSGSNDPSALGASQGQDIESAQIMGNGSAGTYANRRFAGPSASPDLAKGLFNSPTQDGMTVRLTNTADGLQVVLEYDTVMSGSVLMDESRVSRHLDDNEHGWWSWNAGSGSWSAVNVLTSSPLSKFTAPGEKLMMKMDPATSIASPGAGAASH